MDTYRWLVEQEREILLHIEDELRSKNMAYRITTTDGFILGYRASRKEADALAQQQARQLQEVIVIKRRIDGEYVEVARV